jgi:hypothetical protein
MEGVQDPARETLVIRVTDTSHPGRGGVASGRGRPGSGRRHPPGAGERRHGQRQKRRGLMLPP